MTDEIDHVAGGAEHALGAPSHVTDDVGQVSLGRRSKPSSSYSDEQKTGAILALQYNYVAPQHNQPYVRLGVSLRRRLHLGPIDPHPARLGAE